MSTPLCYTKPLSLANQMLIDLVTTRFEGVDSQWVSFDRGTHIELRCPEKIRISPERMAQLKAQFHDSKSVTDKAPSVLRVSGGENGSGN